MMSGKWDINWPQTSWPSWVDFSTRLSRVTYFRLTSVLMIAA